jgi:hypothetical protein
MLMLVAELRPDVVTRTGVVDPFGANRLVQRAQNAINPFINAVRPSGPDVTSPPPAVEIAAAASAVANQLRRGKGAQIAVGTVRVNVSPSGRPGNLKGLSGGLGDAHGSIIGSIVSAAQQLAAGRPVLITSGYGSVVVSPTGQVTAVGGPTSGSSGKFYSNVVAQMSPAATMQAQLATQMAMRNVPR